MTKDMDLSEQDDEQTEVASNTKMPEPESQFEANTAIDNRNVANSNHYDL